MVFFLFPTQTDCIGIHKFAAKDVSQLFNTFLVVVCLLPEIPQWPSAYLFVGRVGIGNSDFGR
jgi:hypothetical protein